MRTFVIGDIHGAHKALVQCLEKSGFDKEKDMLITLGDICDGWPDVFECVQELLTCRNRIDLMGNHDEWLINFLDTGVHSDPLGPWHQGGFGTALSYLRQIGKEQMITRRPFERGYITSLNPDDIPTSHREFFKHQHYYYIDESHRCFVHAGFVIEKTMSENKIWPYKFLWDRELWAKARCCEPPIILKTKDNFDEIFIGHTQVVGIDDYNPVYRGGVWNLDTGAGHNGKLTIMDVETKEFCQSDLVRSLYPYEAARR